MHQSALSIPTNTSTPSEPVGAKERRTIWQGILELKKESMLKKLQNQEHTLLPCTFSYSVPVNVLPDQDVVISNAANWPTQLSVYGVSQYLNEFPELQNILEAASPQIFIHCKIDLKDSKLVTYIKTSPFCPNHYIIAVFKCGQKIHKGFILDNLNHFFNRLTESQRKQQQNMSNPPNVTVVQKELPTQHTDVIRPNRNVPPVPPRGIFNQSDLLKGQPSNVVMANASSGPQPIVHLGQQQTSGLTSQPVSQQSINMPSTIQSKLQSATTGNQTGPQHSQALTTASTSNETMPQSVSGMTVNTHQPNQQQDTAPVGTKDRCTVWRGSLERIGSECQHHVSENLQSRRVTHILPCTFSSVLTNGIPDVNADKWPNRLMLKLLPHHLIADLLDILLKPARHVHIHFNQDSEELSRLLKLMSSGMVCFIPFPRNCDIRIMFVFYSPDMKIYKGVIPKHQHSFCLNFERIIVNLKEQLQKEKSMQIKIVVGHHAVKKETVSHKDSTHDWTVFVRGIEGSYIEHFVEKVVFHLPEYFAENIRVVTEPPYSVSASGCDSYNMAIDVYFCSQEERRKTRFMYDLKLEPSPVNNIQIRKLTFNNLSDNYFKMKLIRAGGIFVAADSMCTASNVESNPNKIITQPVSKSIQCSLESQASDTQSTNINQQQPAINDAGLSELKITSNENLASTSVNNMSLASNVQINPSKPISQPDSVNSQPLLQAKEPNAQSTSTNHQQLAINEAGLSELEAISNENLDFTECMSPESKPQINLDVPVSQYLSTNSQYQVLDTQSTNIDNQQPATNKAGLSELEVARSQNLEDDIPIEVPIEKKGKARSYICQPFLIDLTVDEENPGDNDISPKQKRVKMESEEDIPIAVPIEKRENKKRKSQTDISQTLIDLTVEEENFGENENISPKKRRIKKESLQEQENQEQSLDDLPATQPSTPMPLTPQPLTPQMQQLADEQHFQAREGENSRVLKRTIAELRKENVYLKDQYVKEQVKSKEREQNTSQIAQEMLASHDRIVENVNRQFREWREKLLQLQQNT